MKISRQTDIFESDETDRLNNLKYPDRPTKRARSVLSALKSVDNTFPPDKYGTYLRLHKERSRVYLSVL